MSQGRRQKETEQAAQEYLAIWLQHLQCSLSLCGLGKRRCPHQWSLASPTTLKAGGPACCCVGERPEAPKGGDTAKATVPRGIGATSKCGVLLTSDVGVSRCAPSSCSSSWGPPPKLPPPGAPPAWGSSPPSAFPPPPHPRGPSKAPAPGPRSS